MTNNRFEWEGGDVNKTITFLKIRILERYRVRMLLTDFYSENNGGIFR
jgi:hypothetical protein